MDLDDLRPLVTSRGRDSHIHIFADAQTGLGTMPPRPYSANIVTATTVTHRVEKQRIFESFSMEKLLTATNTFHFEDDGAINICTCNYYKNHEPQQIDYTLFSDNSLRFRTYDSSTTKFGTLGTDCCYQVQACAGKTPRKQTVRKPIGWECPDRIGCNNDVRAFLYMNDGHLAQESRHSDEGPFRTVCFH